MSKEYWDDDFTLEYWGDLKPIYDEEELNKLLDDRDRARDINGG